MISPIAFGLNNKMKIFGFILLSLLSFESLADVPAGILSIQKVYEDIKLPIDNKLLQMRQNFIETPRTNTFSYSSDKDITCPNGENVSRGESLLRLVTQLEEQPLKRTIKTYYGCSQEVAMREMLIESATEYRYELTGPQNIPIFSLSKIQTSGESLSEILLNNQKIYRIQELKRAQYTEYFYYQNAFKLNFSLNGYNLNFDRRLDNPGKFIMRVFPNGRVEYFDPHGDRISKATFVETFQFRGINYFLDALFQDLPETKFINSGSRNQKLIAELRNAQTFLLSNTNIEYVKNLINEYIKNAQEGELIDNR